MKKFFVFCFCFLILTLSLFAFSAKNQKVWTNESDVYKAIRALYLVTGRAEPSSSSPYSGDEVYEMLNMINIETLPDTLIETYNYIKNKLEQKPRLYSPYGVGGTLRAVIEPEVYLHTNKDDFTNEKDWNYGFIERSPLVHLEGEVWATDHFYANVDFGLGPDYGMNINEDDIYDPITENNNDNFTPFFRMNIPFLFGLTDLSEPHRAVVGAGGNHFSFILGRDRLSWGNGVSGNLMLGDNVSYHNFIKFDTHFPVFKFTFLVSFFPHPGDIGKTSQQDPINGVKALLAHRYEFRFFHDKMSLSLNESIMFQSKTNTFDIRVFNPVYLYHDLYIRGNANSLLSLEFSYTIFNGFEVYAQVAMDDVALFEDQPPEKDSLPNAFGYILGVKYTTPLYNGILSTSIEGVYTDPFLYLREEYDKLNDRYGVRYDAVMRYNRFHRIFYVRDYVGYKYGCDALVLDLRADYDRFDRINLNGEFMFMSHGVNDINSSWSAYSGVETVPHTPSSQNPFAKGDEAKKNKASFTFMLSLGGEYKILPRLKVYGNMSMFLVINKGNIEKAPTFDSQFTLGASYTFD